MGAMFSALNNIVLSPLWLLGMLAVIIPVSYTHLTLPTTPYV